MKAIILFILLALMISPSIYAGLVLVNPYFVEQGKQMNITIYPGTSGMNCVGLIRGEDTTDVIGSVRFNCDSNCRCYFPVSANFNATKYMFGTFYFAVMDYSINDFNKGYFNVILEKCSNSMQDNNETGIDCGGNCKKCDNGIKCRVKEDCLSNYCGFENKCTMPNSIKNKEKYSESELFIVSDENWKEVLKLVSISIWKEDALNVKYPVLIYHREGNKFDFDSGINFIKEYNPSHITIFGETPKKFDNLLTLDKKIGGNINKEKISKVSIKDYYSYWNNVSEVVVSDNSYETGINAAVFASYKNAPLVFLEELDYKILYQKKVYVVGEFDSKTINKIKSASNETKEYSLKELHKEYLNLTNTNKVLVVNTQDMNISMDKTFKTKKSSDIKKIYSKNSLAAPFLAAIREELIINVNIPKSEEESNCEITVGLIENYNTAKERIDNQINELFINGPEFLTIVSSPNSIPDSKFNSCHETGSQFREALDKNYAKLGEDYINFGRIYGVTIADTSSYIARVSFYEKLSKQLYNGVSFGLSIGHSFDRYIENSEKQQIASLNSNYISSCYTGTGGEYCTQKIKVSSDEYLKKQYILFGDHGYSNEWADTLKSDKIPELDLSYVFSHACSTNNFWEGNERLMSANMIRQGAIAYIGASGVSYSDNSASESLKKLTSSNISLGSLNKKLIDEFENYKNDYNMIGDPAFYPELKKINWTGISFYDNSIIGVETISPQNINPKIDSLNISKAIYSPDKKIILETVIKNEDDLDLGVYLEYDIYSLQEKYISELELQKIFINANSQKKVNFSMEVVKTMPSGNYKVIVKLLRKSLTITC